MSRRAPTRRFLGPGLLLLLLSLLVLALLIWRGPTPPSSGGRVPAPPGSGAAAVISGSARVLDGDTLEIAGTRLRLFGIDAPEHDQTCRRAGRVYACGQDAATALRGLLAGETVRCVRRDTDRYGRTVAVCTVNGTEVNGWLVGRGYALAYREYSTDYLVQENAARRARRGLHAGTYVNPADFRRGETSPAPPAASSRRAPYASCAQARAAGRVPVLRGEGGYNVTLDGDGDGKMCE